MSTHDPSSQLVPLRVCAIVPAFNEEGSISAVVDALTRQREVSQVLVIDDCSSDETASVAREGGAIVISLPFNLGIGGAVQTGFRYAFENGFDVAIQVDGDGQHDPSEIPILLSPLRDCSADLVIGSRWLGRGSYKAPGSRRFGMRVLSALIRWRVGIRITDTTSGFRAANQRVIEHFASEYPTDYPEVESLMYAKDQGFAIIEVPVRMMSREFGKSSIKGLRSVYYMVLEIMLILIGSIN